MIVRGARIVLGLALLAGSVAAPAGGVDGMEFPNQAPSSDGQGHLMLAGSATLQRNFVPFYGAALYVPARCAVSSSSWAVGAFAASSSCG